MKNILKLSFMTWGISFILYAINTVVVLIISHYLRNSTILNHTWLNTYDVLITINTLLIGFFLGILLFKKTKKNLIPQTIITGFIAGLGILTITILIAIIAGIPSFISDPRSFVHIGIVIILFFIEFFIAITIGVGFMSLRNKKSNSLIVKSIPIALIVSSVVLSIDVIASAIQITTNEISLIHRFLVFINPILFGIFNLDSFGKDFLFNGTALFIYYLVLISLTTAGIKKRSLLLLISAMLIFLINGLAYFFLFSLAIALSGF